MNRERAEAHLRLLAEEELRRATTRAPDGTAGSPPEDEAVRSAGVTGTLAASADVPDAVPASRSGWSAGRAVTQLYSVHYRALVRLAVVLVRDAQTAEQVVQDSFAALRGGWQRLGDADAALAYLRQAVVNRSRSVLRHRLVPGREHRARVARVARVLTAVGALDGEVAGQILEDFELALAVRQAGLPGRPGPGLGSRMRSTLCPRPAMPVSSGPLAAVPGTGAAAGPPGAPGSGGPGAARGRVVRLGQAIPIRGADVIGEVYLLSYARTASGPQFSLLARTRPRSGPATARDWPEIPLLEQFTATDDRGTRYRMRVRDLGGGPDGWTLMLDPDPRHDPRWLDLTTTGSEPAARIDLTRPPGAAPVTVSAATASPGEHLLHAVAARLLAAAAVPQDTGPGPAAPGPGPLPAVADELGDVIAALLAAGALSPLSPVPGQLAALCASLNVAGHGITAAPARDLPGPWLSMLAHCHRRKTWAAPARDGCAAAAAVLPELDGITLSILGLHNCAGSTVLHMHASGPMCHVSCQPDELYYWPVLWIRDSGGRWHATRPRGQSGMNGEVARRLEVVPPLSRAATWIEVLAAGQSAQARVTLPLRWESGSCRTIRSRKRPFRTGRMPKASPPAEAGTELPVTRAHEHGKAAITTRPERRDCARLSIGIDAMSTAWQTLGQLNMLPHRLNIYSSLPYAGPSCRAACRVPWSRPAGSLMAAGRRWASGLVCWQLPVSWAGAAAAVMVGGAQWGHFSSTFPPWLGTPAGIQSRHRSNRQQRSGDDDGC